MNGLMFGDKVPVRAKVWARAEIRSAVATLECQTVQMSQIPYSNVWQTEFERGSLTDGIYELTVSVADEDGHAARDRARMIPGASAYSPPKCSEQDQDNTVEAWPERGLLATQLGLNKNGGKY